MSAAADFAVMADTYGKSKKDDSDKVQNVRRQQKLVTDVEEKSPSETTATCVVNVREIAASSGPLHTNVRGVQEIVPLSGSACTGFVDVQEIAPTSESPDTCVLDVKEIVPSSVAPDACVLDVKEIVPSSVAPDTPAKTVPQISSSVPPKTRVVDIDAISHISGACVLDRQEVSPLATPDIAVVDAHETSPSEAPGICIAHAHQTPPSSMDAVSGKGKRKTHVKMYTLPPCKVCGAPGTGFHYGVNTCEACKGFFRRGLNHGYGFVCRKSGRCRLDIAGKRNMCPHCRWKKCLEVGMSVNGIKTGRYTAQKHTHNTLEVKRLEATKVAGRLLQEETVRQRDWELLLEQITEAFKDTLDLDKHEAQEHLQSYVAQTEDRKPVSYEEFGEILNTTGVQVDDRLEMWQSWLGGVNTAIKRAARFAKAIPGFRELPLEDQAILLKKSINENWLICRHMTFDVDHRIFVDGPGKIFELDKLFKDDQTDCVLRAVRKLQLLRLVSEERALLAAYTVVTADRPDLVEPQQVAALQDQITDVLLWHTRRQRTGDAFFFPHVVCALTELRNLDSPAEKESLESLFKVLLCGNVEVPPIIYELTDVAPIRTQNMIQTPESERTQKDNL